jgi:hypothetical protein
MSILSASAIVHNNVSRLPSPLRLIGEDERRHVEPQLLGHPERAARKA